MSRGSQQITIDGNDFMKGLTTYNYTKDGFIADQSSGVNIASVPGILYAQSPATAITTTTPGTFIASAPSQNPSGQKNYFITTSGKMYSLGVDYTLTHDQTEGVKSYVGTKTDMVVYKGVVYTSSSTDITACLTGGGGNLLAPDETWWTVTKAKTVLAGDVPHPLLVYEANLWIGDAFGLHKFDGTTASYQALLLPQDQNIIALGIEPGSGKMLISTSAGNNANDIYARTYRIAVWDGYSNKVLRSVIVDEMVTAIYPVGGTVFMFYGKNIGYWNGSGITFLRKLRYADYDADTLAYKHHVTHIDNCLYVIDGQNVLAFESIIGGTPKVWYYAYNQSNAQTPNTLRLITHVGQGNLLVAYRDNASANFIERFNTKSVPQGTAGSISLRTRIYDFPTRVRVRMIRVHFADPVVTNKAPIGMQIVEPSGQVAIPMEYGYNELATGNLYYMDYSPRSLPMVELNDFYLYVHDGGSNTPVGIRKITIFYDVVE